MSPWFAALLASAMSLTPATVEQDGVRIEVSIDAHIYTWTVTNLDAPPIMSFEFEYVHIYNPHAPMGWNLEDEGGRIRAWTEAERWAIDRGESASFDVRVTSTGAMLGTVPAIVGFGSDHPAVEFEKVWGPVRKSPGIIALVAALVAGIGLMHALLLARRERRKRPASPTAA